MPLNEAVDGQDVELDYITEGGERDVRLLAYLQSMAYDPAQKFNRRCRAFARHDDSDSRWRRVFAGN